MHTREERTRETARIALDAILDLPDTEASYCSENSKISTDLSHDWLMTNSLQKLATLIIALHLLGESHIWDFSKDTSGEKLLQEMSKVDKAFIEKGGTPKYRNRLPKEIVERMLRYV